MSVFLLFFVPVYIFAVKVFSQLLLSSLLFFGEKLDLVSTSFRIYFSKFFEKSRQKNENIYTSISVNYRKT